MTTFRKALSLAAFFALLLMAAAILNTVPWTGMSWQHFLLWVASFGCFGFLLGGIYAFDPDSELKIKSSSAGRICFGIVASLLLAALWHWPFEGVVLAVIIAAMLGYFGISWVKHINF